MKIKQKSKRCGGWHGPECFRPKKCVVCKAVFKPTSGVNKFCTTKCKGKWKYITGSVTTESQYANVSGNWSRYLTRINCRCRHSSRIRGHAYTLSKTFWTDLLKKQNFKCAVTGEPLTCLMKRGTHFWTNASPDRINSELPYSPNNIRLVCWVVNKMKQDLDEYTFKYWITRLNKNYGNWQKKV